MRRPAGSRPGGSRAVRAAPAIAAALLTLLAYAPSLRGGYVWDDEALAGLPRPGTWAGVADLWLKPGILPMERHYWPLTYTTFQLERMLWGDSPVGSRLVNLGLHLLNGALLWRLLLRLGAPGAGLAAAVFLWHPLRSESVAWIIERKDVLYSALLLAGALVYLRERERRPGPALGAAALLYGLAMLSKSAAVPMPLMLAVLVFAKGGKPGRGELAVLAALQAAGLAAGWIDGRFAAAGEAGLFTPAPFAERLAAVVRGLGFYAGKFPWPTVQMMFYPRWTAPAWAIGTAAAFFALAAAAWLRAASPGIRRAAIAGGILFAAALSPMLGIVPFSFLRHSPAADRFQYLAGAVPAALTAAALVSAAGRLRDRTGRFRRLRFAPALAALFLLPPAALSALRFADEEALWRANTERNPESWGAWMNLGVALQRKRGPEAGLTPLLRAAALHPADPDLQLNLGHALSASGRPGEALAAYSEAAALAPGRAEPWAHLGQAHSRLGHAGEAAAAYSRCVEIDPSRADIWMNLGNRLLDAGDVSGAVEAHRRAAGQRPDWPEARFNLGRSLERAGRASEARAEFAEALRLRPDFEPARAKLAAMDSVP